MTEDDRQWVIRFGRVLGVICLAVGWLLGFFAGFIVWGIK